MLITALVSLALLGAGPGDVSIQLVSGEVIDSRSLDLDGDTLTIDGPSGPVRIAMAQVVAIVGPAAQVAAAPDPAEDCAVLLWSGTLLPGRLLPGRDDFVRVAVAGIGQLSLPIEVVRAVSLGRADGRPDPAGWTAVGEQDRVFRRGPVAGDSIAGTLLRAGSDGVVIENDALGEVELSVPDVLGVAVAELETVEGDAGAVEVTLAGGARVMGAVRALQTGAVRLRTAFDDDLEIAMSGVRRVRFQSELFEYLSDLEPAAVEETPFIGGSDDFLFGWRRDRSVTGEPLSVAGRGFGKGLGMHSRCRLSWDLDGRHRRFRAFAGVSDEVTRHGLQGSLIVRVLVDGEVRFESGPLRAGEPAVPVEVDVVGARRLEIVVDFGDRGDVGDRAVIGDPMLLDA